MEVLGLSLRLAWLLLFLTSSPGCVGLGGRTASVTAPSNAPVLVASQNQEWVWEQVVDVVHGYFDISRENRLDGVIETKPRVGSGLLEPWNADSAGFRNRLESTLQSIRRRGFINVTPAEGGYLVSVEILKEQEDVSGTPNKSVGGSTFQESRPLQRDLTLVVGDEAPKGWIALGRDVELEIRILNGIRKATAGG
ncbi:MAG: hypothetical protein JWM11_5012 [Planctomycetaceae bacterium]|nr:hypothetical protein [Planctomycetaceae bacterium]